MDEHRSLIALLIVSAFVVAVGNTLFGLHGWSGNAAGAFLTSWTFAHFGWLAVCGGAMTAIVIALLIHLGVVPIGKTVPGQETSHGITRNDTDKTRDR